MYKKKLLLVLLTAGLSFSLHAQQQLPDTLIFPEIPKGSEAKVPELAQLISAGHETDELRTYALFYWMAHQIKWDVESFNKEKNQKYRKLEEVLKLKKGLSYEYARLFKELCESIGIRCQVVPGYLRTDLYNDGMSFYEPNHAWNAVLIAHEWRLLDVYQAAGNNYMDLNWYKKMLQKINKKKLYYSNKAAFRFDYDPSWFQKDPEEFRLACLPADPIWQLTDSVMPLSVFEQTDEAILDFNTKYSEPRLSYGKLSEVNRLSDNEAILECADRTYAFNPRYTGMKTSRHIAEANRHLKAMGKAKTPEQAQEILSEAKKELGLSKEMVQEEKQQLSKEYAELRKNNSEKRTDVVKFRQSFTRINSKYITEAGSKITTAETKMDALKSDAASKAKKSEDVQVAKWMSIKTASPETDANSPEIRKQKDSLEVRSKVLLNQHDLILSQKLALSEQKAEQEKILGMLLYHIIQSDSILNLEARARSRKQDSQSDSIKVMRSALHYHKAERVDSLQQAYFDTYDSVVAQYERVKKAYQFCMDAGRSNARSAEAIRKMNSSDKNLSAQYASIADQYKEDVRGYVNNSISFVNYLKAQKELIAKLKKVYEAENDFFERMVNHEEGRKQQSIELIEKNEKIDLKRNEQRKEMIADMKKSLDADYKKALKPGKEKKKKA